MGFFMTGWVVESGGAWACSIFSSHLLIPVAICCHCAYPESLRWFHRMSAGQCCLLALRSGPLECPVCISLLSPVPPPPRSWPVWLCYTDLETNALLNTFFSLCITLQYTSAFIPFLSSFAEILSSADVCVCTCEEGG